MPEKNGGSEPQFIVPAAGGRSANFSIFGFDEKLLGPNEYVQELVIIPYGSAEDAIKPADEGIYMAKNHFHVAYFVGAWQSGHYPDGTPTNTDAETRVVLNWYLDYYDPTLNKMAVLTGNDATISYVSRLAAPIGRFTSEDKNINSKLPGETIAYELELTNQQKAKSAWDIPEVRLRLPAGTHLTDQQVVATYGTESWKLKAEPVGTITTTGYNLYHLSGMTGLSVPRQGTFTLKFTVQLPDGMPNGEYALDAVLLSGDRDYNVLHSDNRRLPKGLFPRDYAYTDKDTFVHFKDETNYPNTTFSVGSNAHITYHSRIKSQVTGNKWSEDQLVAATFGEVVQVRMEIINRGNVNYTGFSLFDILPRQGYLGSSGSLDIKEIEIPPEGTIYYYTGSKQFDDVGELTLPVEDISQLPDWTTNPEAKNTASAFYVAFDDDYYLRGGESITVTIHFQIPGQEAGDQVVYNRYAYSMCLPGGTSRTYESTRQGFSTESYYIEYLANPGLEDELKQQLPVIDSKVFLSEELNYLTVNDLPTRNHHHAVGWSESSNATQADPAFAPGKTIFFSKGKSKITLYPVWNAQPPSFEVPEDVNFGNDIRIISGSMNRLWDKADGKEDETVGVTIHNYTSSSCTLSVKASPLTHDDLAYTLKNAFHYLDDSGQDIALLDNEIKLVYESAVESNTVLYQWLDNGEKVGPYISVQGHQVLVGNYSASLTWQMEWTP